MTRQLVPPLLSKFHKGQAGRIAVIGGCEDYTGAPYFSALAATLLGADMSHVICERAAGPSIKSYSPNLMVHPYLYDSDSAKQHLATYGTETDKNAVLEKVMSVIDRVHVVVVGPGLGRDKLMLETAAQIIEEVKKRKMPLVIDADGLFLISQNPGLIKGYDNAVLTPNVVEFERLKDAINNEKQSGAVKQVDGNVVLGLAKQYGLTILAKGSSDYISGGHKAILSNSMPGSLKRVSGQGDTLSGTLATFLAWKLAFQQNLWDHPEIKKSEFQEEKDGGLVLFAALGASAVTRYAAHKAYEKYGRALLTSNISEFVGLAYQDLLE